MNLKNDIVTTRLWDVISPPWKFLKREVILVKNKHMLSIMVKDSKKQQSKKIFFCGQCQSSNMGDIAQTYCTRKWLGENFSGHKVIEFKSSVILNDRCNTIDKIKEVITNDDFFVFQAGYNTHDLGGQEDFMHQNIILNFPENRIIILPQTVNFKSNERKELCSKTYNSHKRLLFLARDMVSYDLSKEMFPDLKILFFPDIVSLLIGDFQNDAIRKGINLCHRNDVEQYYDEDGYKRIFDTLHKFDCVDVSDTIINVPNKKIYLKLEMYVYKMIKDFSKYRLIVTDKYHGLIFSLISNTPVIVLKTSDHKLTSGYECFSKIFPDRVFYADNEEELAEKTKMILENPHYGKLDNYFKREYYDKLKMIIDEWTDTLN